MKQVEYIEITKVKEKLDSLPEKPVTKKTTSRYEAVKELKDTIMALQGRGYTLDDIASNLSDGGLKIESPTLKAYLSRIRNEGKGNNKVTAKRQQKPRQSKEEVTAKEPQPANKSGEGEIDLKQDLANAANNTVTPKAPRGTNFIKPDAV